MRSVLLLATVMLLAACTGGGGGDQASDQIYQSTGEQSAEQSTGAGNEPIADDLGHAGDVGDAERRLLVPARGKRPKRDTLTFSISGKPAWATFDAATGKLSGAPKAQDVATYSNIVISASDGKVSVNLAMFSISVVATATGAATISWTPPTTYTDGSALTVAGYRIYWGTGAE